MDKVSVITPLYNAELSIASTIESCLRQSYSNFEMLIVDDCSSDRSVAVVERYALKDARIKLIKLKSNSGAAVARNAAIEAATGRYIAFLDADDLWLPHKLETQIRWMEQGGLSFTYSAYDKVDAKGEPFDHVGVPEKVSYDELLKVCVIGCLTVVYDAHKLGKVYMPLIRKRQDWGMWLKLLKETRYAYGCPATLAQYRVRPGSISANKLSAASYTWRLYRRVEGISVARSCYYFAHYAFWGVLRKYLPRVARRIGDL